MELKIRGNGVVVSDELRAFAEKRAARLDRLVDRVVDAKLELRKRHNRVGPDTVTAQLTLQSGRRLLRAEESHVDPMGAIDQAVDKLVRQVRRFHDKRADRAAPRPEPGFAADGLTPLDLPVPSPAHAGATADAVQVVAATAGTDADLDGEADVAPLVRVKRFALKPMDVDEAIAQMELLGHDFFLFRNADEESFNVIYRRRDGAYGLLAPQRA